MSKNCFIAEKKMKQRKYNFHLHLIIISPGPEPRSFEFDIKRHMADAENKVEIIHTSSAVARIDSVIERAVLSAAVVAFVAGCWSSCGRCCCGRRRTGTAGVDVAKRTGPTDPTIALVEAGEIRTANGVVPTIMVETWIVRLRAERSNEAGSQD